MIKWDTRESNPHHSRVWAANNATTTHQHLGITLQIHIYIYIYHTQYLTKIYLHTYKKKGHVN
jgi:hypothetical protein